MSPQFLIRTMLLGILLLAGSHQALAGSTIGLENKGRNNVSVRFITINPNGTILNSPETVHVNANSKVTYTLKDPCIYEIYLNGMLKMSPREKTGLGLGCFNLIGFNYVLVIEADGSVKLQ